MRRHAEAGGEFKNKVNLRRVNFMKSSFCASGECVLVARLSDGSVLVSDGKGDRKQTLYFTSSEWTAFVQGVKRGEFDAIGLSVRAMNRG